MSSPIDLSSLKVVDLRAELSKRDLSTKGKKDELIERLKEAIESENKEQPKEVEQEVEKTEEISTEKTEETPIEKAEENSTEKAEENSNEKANETSAELTKEETNIPSEEEKIETVTETVIEEEMPIDKPIEKPTEEPVEVISQQEDSRSVKRRHSPESDRVEEKRPKVESKDVGMIDSSAIYVKGFVRPLIIKTVQELFGKYGQVKRFWMDSIKTHCYVVYETNKEAQSAFADIDGIVFPKDTGKILTVGGLTPDQVEQLIDYEQSAAEKRLRVDWEATVEKVKLGSHLPSSSNADSIRKSRSIGMGQIAKQLAQAAEPVVSSSRQAQVEIIREPRERTLEDLFCKTRALPHLYYLPVSEEEAKIKLNKLQNVL